MSLKHAVVRFEEGHRKAKHCRKKMRINKVHQTWFTEEKVIFTVNSLRISFVKSAVKMNQH